MTTPPADVPWARPELPGRLSVEETARRIGCYRWLEMRLFEILGGWVGRCPEPEIKQQLAIHCYQHAFHAELWLRRLPELREIDPERLTAPPNASFEQFVTALEAGSPGPDPDDSVDTLDRLAGFYRVLMPHLVAVYSYHRNLAATVTDGPTIRALDLCLFDDQDAWREGEMMVQYLVRSSDDVRRAASRQADLGQLLLESGGVSGPGSAGILKAS